VCMFFDLSRMNSTHLAGNQSALLTDLGKSCGVN
jgi:hypothetical protein